MTLFDILLLGTFKIFGRQTKKCDTLNISSLRFFGFLFIPTVFAPCVQICSTAWRHASFVVTACLPYTRAVESGMVHLNDLRPILYGSEGLKSPKFVTTGVLAKLGQSLTPDIQLCHI